MDPVVLLGHFLAALNSMLPLQPHWLEFQESALLTSGGPLVLGVAELQGRSPRSSYSETKVCIQGEGGPQRLPASCIISVPVWLLTCVPSQVQGWCWGPQAHMQMGLRCWWDAWGTGSVQGPRALQLRDLRVQPPAAVASC